MLYKFKSNATGDLIMLEPNGRHILELIGKGDADNLLRGIVLPADMPVALAAIEQAVARDESAVQKRLQEAQAAGETLSRTDLITLRQRALPFIEMLRRCHKADTEIVWGV